MARRSRREASEETRGEVRVLWEKHRGLIGWVVFAAVVIFLSNFLSGDIELGLCVLIGQAAGARIALAQRVDEMERKLRT